MTDLSREAWSCLLEQLDDPPVGIVAEALANARELDIGTAYDAATATSSTTDSEGRDRSGANRSGSDGSALWDLDLHDLEGISDGDRTKNPFAHAGDSETYLVARKQSGSDVIAKDYKASGSGATYNALTGLLVDAGKRRRDDPEGSLSDAEVFYAWRQARKRGDLNNDDPVPYRALVGIAVEDSLISDEGLVERDGDTGVVVDEDAEETYRALPPGTYNEVLNHIHETYDLDPGRESVHTDDSGEEGTGEYDDDPPTVSATVDPRRAWDAAAGVETADLDGDQLSAAGDAIACPCCGESVDVVRAVAVAEGIVATCNAPLDEGYPEAYMTAREEYGAPLPQYLTTGDAVAEFDAVLDVIGEVGYFQLDEDALASAVSATDDDVDGEAVRALDPAWRESESGESVLVFDSGTVWDADTRRVVDIFRFVALDSGLLNDPRETLEGSDFTDAYRRARTEYGAPLPRWELAADGTREITPQLPSSDVLVETRALDGVAPDALEAAREDVEALLGDATADDDAPTVVTALPATGKTTATIKTAQGRPLSYLAPRKELQAQALDKADRWGVDAEVLPVFSEERVREEVLAAAVSHVREAGKTRLRDRWTILSAAFDDIDEADADDVDPSDIFEEADEDGDTLELDRLTCDTAEGDHGVAWALAVHAARRLGYTPREIHRQARGLFGAPLPCCDHEEDDDACEYSEGWDRVTDADAPPGLLVGSYIHAHVASVRTHFTRAADGSVDTALRAVVLDEFPGETFVREFGDEAEGFATWLAGCLREDVADRRDMLEADLAADEWVRAWLDGRAAEADADVDDAIATLGRIKNLLDAREEAAEILADVDRGALEALGLREPLEAVGDSDPAAAYDELVAAIGAVDVEQPASGLAWWADDAVREPLERATDGGATVVARTSALREDLPVVGDAQVVETWSDTAAEVARAYRRLGDQFTIADIADAVDVTRR